MPGLLIFGRAIALGVLPACALIGAVHLVSMFMRLLRLLIDLVRSPPQVSRRGPYVLAPLRERSQDVPIVDT